VSAPVHDGVGYHRTTVLPHGNTARIDQ